MKLKAGQTITVDGVEVQLWDKAPIAFTPRNHKNPWWARHNDEWYLVSQQRGSSHWKAHLVDEHVATLNKLLTEHVSDEWSVRQIADNSAYLFRYAPHTPLRRAHE